MITAALLALSVVSSIETNDDWSKPDIEDCLVDTVRAADCVPLSFHYAIGETQVLYWKDCYGFTYSHDYQPDDSWDYMVLVDSNHNKFTVKNSGEKYTQFYACGDWQYAYYYKEDCEPPVMPEPTSWLIWSIIGLCMLGRYRR